MSKRSFFNRSKKVTLPPPAPAEPRALDEITKDYATAVSRCGELQYLIYAYGAELEQCNARLVKLNEEGAARNKLDAQAKQAASKAEGAENVTA